MTLRRLLLLALVVSRTPVTVHAQPAIEIQPGSRELDVSRIAPRTDTMAVMGHVEGQEVQLSILVLRTAHADAAGGPVLSRVERMVALNGREVLADSFTVATATLAPLAYAWSDEGQKGSLRANGLRVRGSARATGPGSEVDLRLSAPSFFRNQADLLLAALPLAEGRAFGWRVLLEDEAREGRVEARVAGADRVRTMAGGTCDAWRVELRSPTGTSNYWVDRATGELLQYKDEHTTLRIVRHRVCPSSAEGPVRS